MASQIQEAVMFASQIADTQQYTSISEAWTTKLRNKIVNTMAAGVMIASSMLAGEAAIAPQAQAETITYDDLGYPDANTPCEHAPYSISGSCANYDWGPKHTTVYGDSSTFSSRGYGYRNCTDYVAWKLGELGASVPHNLGNGGDWYTNAAEDQRSLTPKAGDAAVKPTSPSDAYGHVAYVISVNSDGTITISEYNHNAKGEGDIRTGKASDMGFTQFVDFGVHPSSSSGSGNTSNNADGTFIRATDTGNIYEMVGGAPIRQYNWGVLPEFHGQAADVSQAQVNAMPAYPRDGTFVNIQEAGGNGIYEFIGGAPVRQFNWGTLNGFNPSTIRNINYQSLATLDHMRLTPADGTFMNIHEAGGNGVYEFVGGAPIRQYNWGILSSFPGGAMADANYQSLVNLDHMHAVPNNGSFINIHEAGGNGIYELVGGAPIRQTNWGSLPGFYNPTDINYQSLVNLDHMNPVPSDGTFVNIQEAGGNGIYEFVGGAPLRLYNWGILPNFSANMPNINYSSLVNLDHMNAFPSNGEFVASIETGITYRTAGGAALRLYNQGGIPGYNGAIWVNQQTLNTLDHLRGMPADGTVIEGVATQTYWQVQGGKRVATTPNTSAVAIDEQTMTNIPM